MREPVPASSIVAVMIGGAMGTGARYGLTRLFPVEPGTLPWTTLGINVVGALVLGVFVGGLFERLRASVAARRFASTGFLGAFTTFSALAADSAVLARDSHAATALANLALSVALGTAAASLGLHAGQRRRSL